MDKLTVAELRDALRVRGLLIRGNKQDLMDRLQEALAFESADQNVEPSDSVEQSLHPEDNVEQSLHPEDSVSQTSKSSRKTGSSRLSSASSVRLKRVMEAAKKAGLLAKASLLEQSQLKEQEELRIRKEREQEELQILKEKEQEELRIRQEKEWLLVQSEIEETRARDKVLAEFEEAGSTTSSHRSHPRVVNFATSNLNVNASLFHPRDKGETQTHFLKPLEARKPSKECTGASQDHQPYHGEEIENSLNLQPKVSPLIDHRDQSFGSVNKDGSKEPGEQTKLMDTLISYNLKSLMPKAEVQKFSGDITQYRSFIRSFESIISSKLVDEEEKLYYLEQYTSG